MTAGGETCSVAAVERMTLAEISGQQTDTSRFAPLGTKLAEYYEAMVREPLHVQAQECDFLIETATDSLMRQFVAQDVYRHYIASPLMGAENVAVHVFDKWFGSGQVCMQNPEEFRQAQTYADFNRQSLVGKRAPQLELVSVDGSIVTLSPDGQQFSVLYFYDTDCAKCKLETFYLNALLNTKSHPMDFYAIYVGDDQQAWHSYLSDNLKGAVHLWDPEMNSDFQRKYGVTQTPRMFLISPDGVILGRGLDTAALEMMLGGVFAQKNLDYGSKESEMLFDGIFSMYDSKPGVAQVMGIADYIADKTLMVSDTVSFRQLSGDYLYYLSTRSGEGFKEGLAYHINKNITCQPAVWTSQDDSLKVIGFAQIMSDLLSKATPGSKVAGVKVPGELHTRRGVKKVTKQLDKLSGKENVVIFYTSGCEVCAAEKAAAATLVSQARGPLNSSHASGIEAGAIVNDIQTRTQGDVTVFMINVDDIMASDPALASRLMDYFDLSSLPYIIITDSKGIILRRYISLQ